MAENEKIPTHVWWLNISIWFRWSMNQEWVRGGLQSLTCNHSLHTFENLFFLHVKRLKRFAIRMLYRIHFNLQPELQRISLMTQLMRYCRSSQHQQESLTHRVWCRGGSYLLNWERSGCVSNNTVHSIYVKWFKLAHLVIVKIVQDALLSITSE